MGAGESKDYGPLETVEEVDLQKYVGMWYEYAKFPNRFQSDDAEDVTATYTLNEDGSVKVVNKEKVNGEEKSVTGKAWLANQSDTTKLKVSFFWPFAGDYWVIQLDKDYQWAVVGEPKRKYLWILSRNPAIDEATYKSICDKLTEQNYPTEKIKLTPHNKDSPSKEVAA